MTITILASLVSQELGIYTTTYRKDGTEIIPTNFRYHHYEPINMLFENDIYQLIITSKLRLCFCGRKTPYLYRKHNWWMQFRICYKHIDDELRQFIELIHT